VYLQGAPIKQSARKISISAAKIARIGAMQAFRICECYRNIRTLHILLKQLMVKQTQQFKLCSIFQGNMQLRIECSRISKKTLHSFLPAVTKFSECPPAATTHDRSLLQNDTIALI